MIPCVSLLCFMVFGPPGLALGDEWGVSKAPETSVQAYGQRNRKCLAWTNGCVACSAQTGSTQCSTPGIACTPATVNCQQSIP